MNIIGSLAFLIGENRFLVGIGICLGLAGLAIFGMWTYAPDVSPSPFEQNATPTPTPEWLPTPTPTATPDLFVEVNNTTEEEWDVCDDRHNASHLYAMGCYGSGGGSSGGSSSPTLPPPPIPEMRAFSMLLIGLAGIWLIAVRQKGRS